MSEVRQVPIINFAEIESVSKVRARVDFCRQVIHKEVQEKNVGIGVQHSDPLAELVFQKRVKKYIIK